MSYVDCTHAVAPRKSFFSAVPHDLLNDPRLKPRDILLIASILRFARAKGWATMSNRTLASMGRCSVRTIQNSLARLEFCGWIRRVATDDAPGSASGRLIYLNWRTHETAVAPPVQRPTPSPMQPVAPEVKEQERERKAAPMGLNSPGPDGETKAGPTPPSDPLDYAALGWLDRPASDPLRKIAEKAIAARLAGPAAPKTSKKSSGPPRPLLRAPGSLAGMLGRQLAGR